MRVAIVTETFPPEINGVAMTVGKLVEGLREREHEVLLFRPRQKLKDKPQRDATFKEYLVAGVPIPRYHGLKFGLPDVWTLLWHLRRQRVDVVHVVTEGPLGWAAIWVAQRLNLPVTSSFHTNFHSYMAHYGASFLQTLTAKHLRALHNATAVTFVPTKRLIAELAQDGYHNLVLLSRGVDTGLFRPERRSAALRATWGATDQDLVVIHVGRLAAEKNVDLVVAAFAKMKANAPTAKLVLVGDGPQREKLRQVCPGAIFTGSKRGVELAEHYASGDIFLFPSVTETYGNVTSEAMASGLCVVAYDYAAAAELITNGSNGATVPFDAETEFMACAARLSAERDLSRALAANASASVAWLDWQNVHNTFAGKLQEVINSHGKVPLPTASESLMNELIGDWNFPETELELEPAQVSSEQ